MMNDESGGESADRSIWKRAVFMVLFAIIYSITEIVVVVVAVFQFFCVLITGAKNARVLELGRDLSAYIYEILVFETFNSEQLPFPFSPWPRRAGDPGEHE